MLVFSGMSYRRFTLVVLVALLFAACDRGTEVDAPGDGVGRDGSGEQELAVSSAEPPRAAPDSIVAPPVASKQQGSGVNRAREHYQPAGQVGKTPILSWVNSIQSGILEQLPDERWSVPYLWLDRERAADVWQRGSRYSRPLRDNPVGLRGIRPYDTYWLKGDGRSGESRWGFRDELILSPGTASERSLGYIAPWFDEWRAEGRAKQERVASEMFSAGGQIDYLILDWEDYNTLYTIERDLRILGHTLDDFRRAVVQDPRWPSLRRRLNRAAAAAGYDTTVVNFDADLADIADWNSGHSPKGWVWGRYMHSQIVDALNHIIYEPWAARYPNIKASDYQKYVSGPWPDYAHATWSVDSPTVPLQVGTETTWVFGTHQAPEAYGRTELDGDRPMQIHLPAQDNPPQLPLSKWNPPTNISSQYAALIRTLRKVRGAIVGRPGLETPPLMMWIAGDQYDQSLWVPAGGAPDYQWFAEGMFHLGLHGVTTWLYWNTHRSVDGTGELRVTQIVDEIDQFVGGLSPDSVLVTSTVDWDRDRYLLSGRAAGEWDIYRFTPGQEGSVVASAPFRFRFADGQEVVPVPDGARFEVANTMSGLGHWIVAPRR